MEAQQSRKFSKVSAIRLTQGAATLSVGMKHNRLHSHKIIFYFVALRLTPVGPSKKHSETRPNRLSFMTSHESDTRTISSVYFAGKRDVT